MRAALLRPSIWNGSGFAVASIATILWYYLVLNRYSGQDSAALLLAISTAGVITLVDMGVSLGVISVLSRLVRTDSAGSETAGRVVSSVLTFTTLLAAIVGVGIVTAGQRLGLIEVEIKSGLAIIAFAVSGQLITITASAMKGALAFLRANIITTLTALLVFGGGSIGILVGLEQTILFLCMTFLQVCAALSGYLMLVRTQPWTQTPYTWRVFIRSANLGCYVRFLRSSITYFPQTFSGTFFAHIQRFFIGYFLGPGDIARLAFAYSLATRAHAFINSFLEVIFPFAHIITRQGLDSRRFALKVGLCASAILLPVAAGVTTLAMYISVGTAMPTSLYLLGVLFAVAAAPAFHLLNAHGFSMRLSIITLGSPLVFSTMVLVMSEAINVEQWLFPFAYGFSQIYVFISVFAMLVMTGTRRKPARNG